MILKKNCIAYCTGLQYWDQYSLSHIPIPLIGRIVLELSVMTGRRVRGKCSGAHYCKLQNAKRITQVGAVVRTMRLTSRIAAFFYSRDRERVAAPYKRATDVSRMQMQPLGILFATNLHGKCEFSRWLHDDARFARWLFSSPSLTCGRRSPQNMFNELFIPLSLSFRFLSSL